jgi:hypothetical protein
LSPPDKPRLSASALFDLSVANMASAVAFALVQGNMARIFQTLGADLGHLHIANRATPGAVPPSVRLALLLAAGILLAGVGWTVSRIREYSPEEQARFSDRADDATAAPLSRIALDLWHMPRAMRRLATIHFFTWFALFIMWPFMTPVVTQYAFHATDPASAAYNRGADFVGLLFAGFNVVAAVFGMAVLPWLARRLGNARAHALCLGVGVASYLLLATTRQPDLLFVPFAGLGVAWASLLTLPFVMLTNATDGRKLGVLFNLFVVLPQIAVATVMGPVLHAWFPQEPMWTMVIAAAAMAIAALLTLVLRPDRAGSGWSHFTCGGLRLRVVR